MLIVTGEGQLLQTVVQKEVRSLRLFLLRKPVGQFL